MPCLNEAEGLPTCLARARRYLDERGLAGELIVADNGSTDGSQALAAAAGARLIEAPRRGYGAALRAGLDAARGDFLIMGDADASYDFAALDPFIERLRAGADLVIGNRFKGGIAPGAMPPLHQYFGNPFMSAMARLFFKVRLGDVHCGLRALSRAAYQRIAPRAPGMEFASELFVRAQLLGLRLEEVPTTLSPALRSRPPHLRSFRDGFRHLALRLRYTPRFALGLPGASSLGIGAALSLCAAPCDRLALALLTLGEALLAAAIALSYLGPAARLRPPPVPAFEIAAFLTGAALIGGVPPGPSSWMR